MSQITEAAGLLRSGALYTKRIGLATPDGRLIFAGVKRGAFSLYYDDEPIYHFDLDGRWQRAYLDGDHYKKALNQAVDRIGRAREPANLTIHRYALSRAEIAELDDAIRAAALDLSEGLGGGRFALVPPPSPVGTLSVEELHDLLDRIASWDAVAWFARKEAHVRVYGATEPFVPPDCQNAIVLDPFRNGDALSREDFSEHCREVANYLGRRAIQASVAFLSGDGALRRSIEEIAANLDAIATAFPIRDESRPLRPRDLPHDRPSLSGVDLSFDFYGRRRGLPDRDGWRALAGCRVRRVTASFAGEGDGLGAAESLVAAKEAGVAVSVVVPCAEMTAGRLKASADAIEALPLVSGDIAYLVGADDAGHRDALAGRLPLTRGRGVKIRGYDPAKQWT